MYELLPCKKKCKDISEVLCYLQKELGENLESTQTLIECFNPDCFVCTPDTIFANILETDCLTEGALGQVSYINFLVNTPSDTLCQELAILSFTIEVVALSYRFLQNALRTFYCEDSCYKSCYKIPFPKNGEGIFLLTYFNICIQNSFIESQTQNSQNSR